MIGFTRGIRKKIKTAALVGTMCLAMGGLNPVCANTHLGCNGMPWDWDSRHHNNGEDVASKWMSGDFHQHTLYTDGSTDFPFVMQKNYEYGLDWWANSEHGGGRVTDGQGKYWDDDTAYPKNPIQGDVATSSGHQVMWRWQSVRDFAYADILKARSTYFEDNKIFSGLEWNVPGHEHCSVSLVAPSADAISAFEFQFDNSDNDTSRIDEATPFGKLEKRNGKSYSAPGASDNKLYPERHQDAVAAASWMEEQYKKGRIDDAWIIFAHIERKGAWDSNSGGGYNIEHFRDFNNAAPDICYGFEGAPGHQANADRGGFSPAGTFGGTYGGVGYYSAKLGGLWDALLGEGRHWFNFANSDYHEHYSVGGDDFYPGEYQKTWVNVKDLDGDGNYSLKEIAAAQRSGDSFFVMGDLIDALEFTASQAPWTTVTMGQNMHLSAGRFKPVTIQIRFKSPEVNNNNSTPVVDHVDLIAGDISGKIRPSNPNYSNATNPSTRVVARFSAADWTTDADGYNVITYQTNLTKDTYFRLRGTNNTVNQAWETKDGEPLADSLATNNLGLDGADEAWADLWFYSNPIFIYVR